MKSRKRGHVVSEAEKLLSRVVKLLTKARENREAAERLLAEGMAAVEKELKETEDMSRVDRIAELAEKVRGLAKRGLLTGR